MRRVALVFALSLAACHVATPEAREGVLDLRATDGEAVRLRGRWQFFWQELVDPGKEAAPDAWLPIRRWTGLSLDDGRALPGTGFATYRLRVLLPAEARRWTLAFDPLIDASRAWVTAKNGEQFGPVNSGEVGTTPETSRGALVPSLLSFSAANEITVTVQVSNFDHARGGSGTPALFGSEEAVAQYFVHQRTVDFFYIGLLMVMGLHHLWLFALRRRERPALWFALICITIAIRATLLGRYVQIEWPTVPLWITVWLEYLTFYGALSACGLYLHALFPRDIPRWFARAGLIVSGVCALTLLLPKIFYSQVVLWFQFFVLASLVVAVVGLVRAARRERDLPPVLVLMGLGCLGVAAVIDILRERSLLHVRFTAHYGVAAFVLFQSALLALLNQRRATQLEQRNVEVQQLNDELRRQIATRSHELSQVVMMVARGGGPVAAFEGMVIGGQYRIRAPLGEGAMGAVFKAQRVADDKWVALKLIHGGSAPDKILRFVREAEVVARIDHRHVIGILDFGVSDGGVVYIAMELMEGGSVEQERPRFGDVAWALPLLRQLAEALNAIHSRGVIHRDVKPSNLLIAPDGELKLADFGIAHTDRADAAATWMTTADGGKTAEEQTGDLTLTRAGMFIGSPMYMAPELAAGAEHATVQSDIYSFGVVAYEMLTAKRPYEKPLVLAQLDRTDVPPPARIETLRPAVDLRLATLVHLCLSATPETRPSAATLLQLLASFDKRQAS